jgi:hypothetical protein
MNGQTIQREESKAGMTKRQRERPRDKTCECGKKFHDYSQTNKRRTCGPICARIRHDRQTQESKDRAKALRGDKKSNHIPRAYTKRAVFGKPELIDAICLRCGKHHRVDGRRYTKWSYCDACAYVRELSDYTQPTAGLVI